MSTYAVPRDLTGFESMEAFQQYEAHGVTGVFRGAADVRSQKHILQCTVAWVYLRLMIENIQAGSEYPPGDQGFNQCVVVNHLSSGYVDHDGVGRQQIDALTIEKSGQIRGTRSGNQKDVARLQQTF